MFAAAVPSMFLSANSTVIRGVYADHSVTLQAARYVDFDVSRSIARRAESIAGTGANVAWITNLPDDPAVIARYVTELRARGVEIVAGSGHWYIGSWNYARTGEPITLPYRHLRLTGARLAWRAGVIDQQFATIQRLRAAIPADAQPWRWSLGDEPPPESLAALQQLAGKCRDADIPTTMVQVPEYHAQTLTTIGNRIPVVSCDVYPFFQPGLPSNPPYGPAALTWFRNNCRDVVARSKSAGVTPVLMTQGFGGDALFRMPTPAQTRWQVWAAIANGSPGAIVFAHGMASPDGGPTPPMASLVDWQGPTESLTPAGVEIAKTYGRLQSVESLLQGSTIETGPTITLPAAGDVAAYVRTATGRRLLIVVADPDQPQRTLKMTLPGVSSVSSLAGSTGGTFSVLPWPWYLFWPGSLSVSVSSGDAWIGEVR